MVGSHFNEAAANDALQRMAAGVPPMASAEYLTAAAVLQFDPGRCATGTGSGSPERRRIMAPPSRRTELPSGRPKQV